MHKYILFFVSIMMLIFPVSGIAQKNGDENSSLRKNGVNVQPAPNDEHFIYLPLVLKNYPLINIFGIAASSNLDLIQQSGGSWIRMTYYVNWSKVEQTEDKFDWSTMAGLENLLLQAAKERVQTVLVIQMSPEWARKYSNSPCGPIRSDKLNSFAKFAAEVVKQYSVPPYNIKYFQIWNEQDAPVSNSGSGFGCWGEFSDSYFGGEYYGQMLETVYPAMKAANPSIQVVTGAFLLDCDPRSWGDGYCATKDKAKQWNFFEGVVKRAKNYFDVVSFNGYAYYQEGKNTVWAERFVRREWAAAGGQVDGKINYLLQKMSQYGINKPIMLAESAIIDINSEEAKSDYLVWTYANTWSKGLKATFWYSLEGWRGSQLIYNNTPLPAYYALQTMTGILGQSDFKSREDNLGYTKFVFTLGSQEIWLLIPTGEVAGTEYSISRPSNFIKLVNIYGVDQPDPGNPISFSRPVYVFRNK